MNNIAVLIPSYKPKEYILQCLQSIEDQTLSKDMFCVYIALNGPKEPYLEFLNNILNKFSFDYNLIYLSQAGVSNARNHLIDISNEPFIVFLDDDDLVSNNYLEELTKVSSPNTMGISNIRTFEDNILNLSYNYMSYAFLKIKDRETSKFKTRKYYSSPVAKMLHRSMINNIRFNKKLKTGEDSLFMAQISNNIQFIRKTDENTFYYIYKREGSLTRSKINRILELKRIYYLVLIYSKMFISTKYDKTFIATRILATLKHSIKLL